MFGKQTTDAGEIKIIVILKKASKWHVLASSFGDAESSVFLPGKIGFAGGASLAPGVIPAFPVQLGQGRGLAGGAVLGEHCGCHQGIALGEGSCPGRALAEQKHLSELLPPGEILWGGGQTPLCLLCLDHRCHLQGFIAR